MSDRLVKNLLPVLVVDDEPEILKAVARDLRRHAQVETASSPEEGLRMFEAKEYSVIVSDLRMPNMSGLELLARCAAVRPDSQRVLLTAFADLASLEDSVNRAQINLLLTKPWEPGELQIAIEGAQRRFETLKENAELRRLALTDALTGVSNHRYFWERLEAELSRSQRYGRPISLIFCDIDDFKKFNDEKGHQVGDEVLRKVAQTLDRARRSMDTVARYGGEEFAVILPECSRPAAAEIARRFLETVRTLHGIGISAGVASYPDDARSSTELVHMSDSALLKAKASGKGRVMTILEAASYVEASKKKKDS